jgi:S-adenosylmethionine synthetase
MTLAGPLEKHLNTTKYVSLTKMFSVHRDLKLKRPIFEKTCIYGHFKSGEDFTWEHPKKLVV